ncbi:MAG: DUF4339 domain-containing protein [Chthoniobacterales bacterium]
MPQQWFIRVDGKEYGPADVSTLREWQEEGRLLPTNEVRMASQAKWQKAANIEGLFEAEPPPIQRSAVPQFAPRPDSKGLVAETFACYTRGFFKYLGLTLLVLGPALCSQFTSAFVGGAPGADASARTIAAELLGLCMMLLAMVLMPVYIAGIQILTAAFAAGERIGFFATLNEAVKYWPRVALVWLFVLVCYVFWTLMPILVIASIALSGMSILSFFLILLILAIMVWVTSRLFVNFMFWQQFAVLENCGVLESLRRSRALARSGSDLPWFRRPMYRGVIIASIWFAVVFALNWPAVSQSFQLAFTLPHDPQMAMQAISNAAKSSGNTNSAFAASLLQAILKPLLGIAFVLLFLNSNRPAEH